MSTEVQSRLLGRCPACGATIPADRLLAKYEAPGEWPRIYAECPGCECLCRPA